MTEQERNLEFDKALTGMRRACLREGALLELELLLKKLVSNQEANLPLGPLLKTYLESRVAFHEENHELESEGERRIGT